MVDHKIAHFAQKYAGNSIGLYGSGKLTMEGQYMENLFMKGDLGSNTIEANARMCMTSAVTGYFATFGSDTPPLAYVNGGARTGQSPQNRAHSRPSL